MVYSYLSISFTYANIPVFSGVHFHHSTELGHHFSNLIPNFKKTQDKLSEQYLVNWSNSELQNYQVKFQN